MNYNRFFTSALSLVLIMNLSNAQVMEGFNGNTFPPLGWTSSISSGTTFWTRITSSSSTRNGSQGAASSNNPAAGVSRHLTLSMNASGSLTSVSYYVSVSNITSIAGAKLIVQGGIDTTSLTVLRTINLQDTLVFIDKNMYIFFTDQIDGTLASGQTGAVDLRSQNPAYIRWTHQKTTGMAAACRLEDVSVENATALPVELVSFNVVAIALSTQLRWSTASETNNYGFEIERRVMGVQKRTSPAFHGDQGNSVWTRVGFVPGSGTSSSPKEYSYKDVVPLSGRYAYRLKQIDHDGTYEYYHAAQVEVGLMPKRLELFPNVPNPFNPATSIGFTLPEDGHGTLKVFDILGREVQTVFEGDAEAGRLHQSVFDAGSLSSGIYFSRLEYKGQVLVKKMVLMR